MWIKWICLLGMAALVLSGCASSEVARNYTTRKIDEPYALPKGMHSWRSSFFTGHYDDGRYRYRQDATSFSPFEGDVPITDNLTLEVSPLPLSARYQFHRSEWLLLGTRFGSGIGYSTLHGLILAPRVEGYFRLRLGANVAWLLEPRYEQMFIAQESPRERKMAHLSTGPMFQITDFQVLRPRAFVTWRSRDAGSDVTSGATEFEIEGVESGDYVSYGTGLNYAIRLDQQWQLEAEYAYLWSGGDGDHRIHRYGGAVTHYW